MAVIVLENHEAADVLGHMPYLDSLAATGGLATNAYARTHPSLPNYLELLSGQTSGITSDCTSCTAHGPSLADQLDGAGVPWRAYMEGISGPCPRVAQTEQGYAKKHDPFAYFPSVMARDCNWIVPAGQLTSDLGGADPPDFVWLTPNLCHDGHDCGLDVVDRYLSSVVPGLLGSAWFQARGVLVVTFDEGTTNAACCQVAVGGHIVTVVVRAAVSSGAAAGGGRWTAAVDHAGTLGTIEDLYGLSRLADATCLCAGSLHALTG